MVGLNHSLLKLARLKLAQEYEKAAVVPAGGGGMPPGGAPPMDPAMMGGGMPPGMDPAMMGGMPPGMPPGGAPMGAPPMPPSPDGSVMGMAGAAMDPAMMAQAMPQPGAPAPGGAAPAGPAAPPKMKPEQYFQILDQRMYNLQQQITAMLNAQGVKLDPSVLTIPPNSGFVQPEQAIQGQAADPGAGAAPQGGGGGGQPQSAIQPIDPMQGAFPGGGAASKAASLAEQYADAIARATCQPYIPKTAAAVFGAAMAMVPDKIRALRQLGLVK